MTATVIAQAVLITAGIASLVVAAVGIRRIIQDAMRGVE